MMIACSIKQQISRVGWGWIKRKLWKKRNPTQTESRNNSLG
jgi:hypothetical protein